MQFAFCYYSNPYSCGDGLAGRQSFPGCVLSLSLVQGPVVNEVGDACRLAEIRVLRIVGSEGALYDAAGREPARRE